MNQWVPSTTGEVVVLLLALYGAGALLLGGVRLLLGERRPAEALPVAVLVLVRNQEEAIEGFVRVLLYLMREGNHRVRPAGVFVADSGSQDATPLILKRLARQAPGLRLIDMRGGVGRGLEEVRSLSRSPLTVVVDLQAERDTKEVLADLERLLTGEVRPRQAQRLQRGKAVT